MKKHGLLTQFFRYTGLNILGMLGFAFYVFVDTYFIAAGMGMQGLSALNQALPVYNLLFGVCLMVAIGCGSKISMYRSLDDQAGVKGVMSQALILGLFFVLIFEYLAWQEMPWILDVMGVDEAVYEWSYQYSQIILLFSPMFMLNQIAVVAVRNEEQPRLAMVAMISGSLFNVVADYIFIFQWDMGMRGAALATGTAPLVSTLILLPYLLSPRCHLRCRPVRPHVSAQVELCLLGGASLVLELSSGVVLVLFNRLMLAQGGNPAVAAYGVIANLSIVILAIYTGIAQGIQPLCSEFSALKKRWELHFILRMALLLSLTVAAVIYAGLVFFDTPLVQLFNGEGNQSLQEMAEYGLRRYFLCLFFAGANIVLAAFFAATAHPTASLIISTARGGILLIPISLIMSAALGMEGIWLSMPVTEGITAIVSVSLLLWHNKIYS